MTEIWRDRVLAVRTPGTVSLQYNKPELKTKRTRRMKMNKFKIILLLAFLFVLHTPAVEAPKGFTALFNGEDLTGWHGLNPHSVAKLKGDKREAALKKMRDEFSDHWRVEKGELVNTGTGPYANTDARLR